MSSGKEGYLGLDIGGGGAKAGVFDGEGATVGIAQRAYSPRVDANGHVELPIETIYNACREACREAVHLAGIGIRAMSISSQGQTFVSLDEQDQPLHPALIWYDSRATEHAARLADAIRRRTSDAQAAQMTPIASAAKIRWLLENQPAVMARARRFLLLPDYFSYRLTGSPVYDPTTASSTGLFDVDRGAYCQAALEETGIRREQMSAVQPAGAAIGRVLPRVAEEWGLSNRTLLAVGTNDQLAGALGAGNCRIGIGSETTGTCLALITLALRRGFDLPPGLLTGIFPIPELRFILAFCKTAGVLLDWFRREFTAGASLNDLDTLAAQVPPGSRGLVVLPHFDGMVSPSPNPASRGVFCNLNLNHSRSDIYRAILESLAFSLRENLELAGSHGFPMDTLRSIGGGARSDLWLQIKADVCGMPIERPVVKEAAVLGAAMLAAVGSGDFQNVAESSRRFYRIERVFHPDLPNAPVYEKSYGDYRRLQHLLFPN